MRNTRLLSLFFLLFAWPCFGAFYFTTFTNNAWQNPIYEGGNWINGKATGLDWSNCATAANFVYGTQTGAGTGNGQYSDSHALLTGTWGATQAVSAVVKVFNQASATVGQEVEIRLLSSVSSHSSTGYEVDYSVCAADPYVAIARWDGALGNYAILGAVDFTHYAADGDKVTGLASNGVIYLYINDVLIISRADSTYTSGKPGIGFFLDNNNGTTSPGNSTNFGFSSLTAWDNVPESFVNHTATSASLADVQASQNWCVDTDTNTIPAGNEVGGWTNTLYVTNAITMIGNGVGSTIVSNNQNTGSPLVQWNLRPNQNSRMSGIEFRRGTNGSHFWQCIQVNGANTDARTMRIDHCQFTSLEGGAILPFATVGVFDHNTIITEGTPAWIGYIKGNNWGDSLYGDGAYTNADQFGSSQFFFIEDNILTNRAASHITMLDAQAGARYVFRHNKVYKGSMESHGLEAQRERSGRAFEIYINTFDGIDTQNFILFMRGGNGLVWSNYVFGYSPPTVMNLPYYRLADAVAQPFGQADGRNPWDTNSASNPFVTGTCSSAGALTMTDNTKTWTTDQWKGYVLRRTSGKTVSSITRSGSTVTVNCTAHQFTNGQYVSVFQQPYTVNAENPYSGTWLITSNDANSFSYTLASGVTPTTPATATFFAATNNYSSEIIGNNTSGQVTFKDSVYGGGLTMTWHSGETYEINHIERAMDEQGLGLGPDLAGADMPTINLNYAGQQALSGWYSWTNMVCSSGPATIGGAASSFITFSPVPQTLLRANVNYFDNQFPSTYSSYLYPHPLVAPGGVVEWGATPDLGKFGSIQGKIVTKGNIVIQ